MPVGSLISGFIGQQGQQAAGNMAAAGAAQGAQRTQQANDQDLYAARVSRNALTPWTGSGTSAQGKIDRLLGLGDLTQAGNDQGIYWVDPANAKALQQQEFQDFRASPDYQWRLDQGSRALDRSAAARGMTLSGAQGQAQQDYGQGAASQEYGNYFNRLSGVANGGRDATTSANNTSAALTAAGGNALVSGGNMLAQGGAQQGSAYAAGSNALASGIGSAVNSLGALYGAGAFDGWGGGSGSLDPSLSNGPANAAVAKYGTVPFASV